MRPPFPWLWLTLVAMWLVLNGMPTLAQVIVGAAVALAAVLGRALLQPAAVRLRRPWAAVTLAGIVLADVARSNVEVAMIVLRRQSRGRVAGFARLARTRPILLSGPLR